MRQKEMIEKIKDLEHYIDNVSSVQGQLLKDLGYETYWVTRECCHRSFLELNKKTAPEQDPCIYPKEDGK